LTHNLIILCLYKKPALAQVAKSLLRLLTRNKTFVNINNCHCRKNVLGAVIKNAWHCVTKEIFTLVCATNAKAK
ncbi:hypothetical protein COY07_01450, partial [Candidatus Peregrinibacteria bacterium CG_4_10_14_0_2_um_filter_43_11]